MTKSVNLEMGRLLGLSELFQSSHMNLSYLRGSEKDVTMKEELEKWQHEKDSRVCVWF